MGNQQGVLQTLSNYSCALLPTPSVWRTWKLMMTMLPCRLNAYNFCSSWQPCRFMPKDRTLMLKLLKEAGEESHLSSVELPSLIVLLEQTELDQLLEINLVVSILLQCEDHESQRRCIYLIAKVWLSHDLDIPPLTNVELLEIVRRITTGNEERYNRGSHAQTTVNTYWRRHIVVSWW